MMLKTVTVRGLALGVAVAALWTAQALAYAPENDLMKIKGYSPETIQAMDTQRSRQEWREPVAPKRGPVQKFFHNVYYGNWIGDVDEFGSQVIRP